MQQRTLARPEACILRRLGGTSITLIGDCGLQALLDAEARGDTWRDHGLSQAPHFLHEDGTVKVLFVPKSSISKLC